MLPFETVLRVWCLWCVVALPQKQNHSSELEIYLAEIQYFQYKQKISVEIIISLVALNVKLFKIN